MPAPARNSSETRPGAPAEGGVQDGGQRDERPIEVRVVGSWNSGGPARTPGTRTSRGGSPARENQQSDRVLQAGTAAGPMRAGRTRGQAAVRRRNQRPRRTRHSGPGRSSRCAAACRSSPWGERSPPCSARRPPRPATGSRGTAGARPVAACCGAAFVTLGACSAFGGLAWAVTARREHAAACGRRGPRGPEQGYPGSGGLTSTGNWPRTSRRAGA